MVRGRDPSGPREKDLSERAAMHGPLGCDKLQGAVLFSGERIGAPVKGREIRGDRSALTWNPRMASVRRPGTFRAAAPSSKDAPSRPILHESEFIFNSADGVLGVDRGQRIVLWNEGAERLLGFKVEDVLGRYCHEILGGRDESGGVACQARCPDMMAALRRELVRTQDLLVRTLAGCEVWVSISTIQVPSRWRDLCVLVHLFHDVNRQKDMERFVEQLRSKVVKLSLSHGVDPPSRRLARPVPLDLTRRQREVLRLLASGASTQAIAHKLFITPATARHHIYHLLAALGVHSRLEAVTLALRNGLI